MNVVDALLLVAGVLAFGAAFVWAVLQARRFGWREWLGAWVLSSAALNVLLWRLDGWSLRPALVLTGLMALVVAVGIWRWNSPYDLARTIAERRRAHYGNYPFNQWKPKDVDEPLP